jgi:hypothetical protein
MSTHSQLGIKFPDDTISGCYVHYDGHSMLPRIKDYLKTYTITNLVLLIAEAQSVGGIRSFHIPPLVSLIESDHIPMTELLTDHRSHVINEDNWGNGDLAESYFWLIDYETGDICGGWGFLIHENQG